MNPEGRVLTASNRTGEGAGSILYRRLPTGAGAEPAAGPSQTAQMPGEHEE